MAHRNKLLVILGATATGKTGLAVKLAQHFGADIISADSRQVFRELTIGVASPSEREMAQAHFHFIKSRSVREAYSAGQFGDDVLELLEAYYREHHLAILAGGSGLYIKAVCEGFDDVPPSDEDIRRALNDQLEQGGFDSMLRELREVDPDYYATVDRSNPRRVLRGLEVVRITGRPFSSFRRREPAARHFEIMKIGLELPKDELAERIRSRVDAMVQHGLVGEVRSLVPYRHLPALQAVGYRELFEHFDGITTLDEAIDRIKRHTIQFAKRQVTWWRKEPDVHWYDPGQLHDIVSRILPWLDSSGGGRT